MKLLAIDLFSGCGGLTEGMRQASFETKIALEINPLASCVYSLNHPQTKVIVEDIRNVNTTKIKKHLKGKTIHLLAGCPPCQGFSSIRRLNKTQPIEDERNALIMEYVRMVRELLPHTIMMENVPGLINYDLFKQAVNILTTELNYHIDYRVVNVKDYGVPQNRKRLVLVGSRLGEIKIAEPIKNRVTVRDIIGDLAIPSLSMDPIHKIFPTHTTKIQQRISITPKDGGSRKDLPDEYKLSCHKKPNVGFHDVYGRLQWDNYSSTITGGCLNPSKGRFLHPEQDRCISAREAALLQSFPADYKFLSEISKTELSLMIGNALPPTFSYHQSKNLKNHLLKHLQGTGNNIG